MVCVFCLQVCLELMKDLITKQLRENTQEDNLALKWGSMEVAGLLPTKTKPFLSRQPLTHIDCNINFNFELPFAHTQPRMTNPNKLNPREMMAYREGGVVNLERTEEGWVEENKKKREERRRGELIILIVFGLVIKGASEGILYMCACFLFFEGFLQ